MTGVATTPNNVANMIAMRSAGWTVSAIANYTGSSPATINRYLIKHKAKKGALTEQAIEDAKALLLAQTSGDIAQRISSVLEDDYALFLQIRNATSIAVDALIHDTTLPSHYTLRGLAAAAVTMTATQACIRKTFQIDDMAPAQLDIPVLVVSELTINQIEELRAQQKAISIEHGFSFGHKKALRLHAEK
jgi:hypothetical protein